MNKSMMLIGVFKKGSTNVPQALAFSRRGFDVVPINYREIISKYGIDYFYNLTKYAVEKYKPILILFSKCNGIDSKLVQDLSSKSITWLWNMDPVDTIKQCPEVIEHAKYSTYSSCTSPTVKKYFEDQGVKNCSFILEGLDYDVYKPVDSSDEYKADISFIGTRTKERDEYKKFLEEAGYNIRFYGPGYNREIVDEEFAKICASSKFMLSLNTYNNIAGYFSDRPIRYLGCGACVLHLDSTNSLNNFFEDKKEIIYFSDKDDLLNKIASITEEERIKLIFNGRDRVLRNYTWNNIINQILTIAFSKQLSIK